MNSEFALSYQGKLVSFDWESLPGAYSVRNFTVKDGLPINSVNYISGSHSGYLFMATNDGLARFDGVTFTVYNTFNSPTLRSNRIAWVGEFGEELWLTDDQRNVYRYRNGELLCMQDLEGLEEIEGYKIAWYDEQTVLITTSFGFYKVTHGQFEFERYEDPRTYVHFDNSFSFGRDSVYFIDERGLNRIKNDRVFLVHSTQEFNIGVESVFNLVPTQDGELWLLSDNGYLTKVSSGNQPESFFLAPGIEFRDAIEIESDQLLLSTNRGYFRFDRRENRFSNTGQISDSESYFEDNAWNSGHDEVITVFNNSVFVNGQTVLNPTRSISYLMRANDESIWVATNGGGVYQIRKNKLITIGAESHPGFENTYGLNEHSGEIWVSAFNNYVFTVSNNAITHLNATNTGFTQPFFRTVEITKNGDVYAGNFDVWKKRYGTDSWEMLDFSHQSGLVNVLYEDEKRRLWIGTNYGLFIQENNSITRFTDADSTQFGSVQAITELKNGTLLFATKNQGVAVLSTSGNVSFIDARNGLSSNIVRDVAMFSADTLWIATEDKGLNRVILDDAFNAVSTKSLTTNDGLNDNSLHRIIKDDYGYLWLNSNRGIMRISYRNINAYLEGNELLLVQHFSEEDGLVNIEGNGGTQKAGFITTDGKLLFPNQAGLVYTRPEWHLEDGNSQPETIIVENIQSADSALTLSSNNVIELPERVRELSIDFTLPKFTSQNKLQFEYKLEGVNTDWVNIGNERSANFSNLPSGTHTLHIRGRVEGEEVDAEKTLTILVPARFHETSIFVFAVILGLIGAFFGFLRMAMNQAKKREQTLNRLVDERTLEVVKEKEKTEQAMRQLEELSESKSRFFTNFTHELRTPLTLILNPLEDIIQKRTGDALEKDQSLLLVQRNAQRLKKLVNTLLDISKLNANELNIIFRPVNILEITTRIASQFEHELAKKNISFSIQTDEPKTMLYLDINAWDHICTNLISNAIKFTNAGGTISIQISQQNEKLAIAFEDSGIGIPESELAHIFDIYYQGDSLITRSGGTGIGLTLVKGFVERLKGQLSVASTVGEGTRFEIAFPLGKQHLKESEVVEDQFAALALEQPQHQSISFNDTLDDLNEGKLKKRKVVLVEDNEDMRAYIAQVISSEYEVKVASNGKEGLRVIKEFSPELIVSDIMMPEMDGIEMMHTIRINNAYKHIPFVFLTAKDSAADIQKGLNLGADVYLTKPIENNMLLLQIKVLLRREQKVIESEIVESEHPLIGQVTSIIARHLGNPDLSIELMAEALAMSESTLYRKWRKVSEVTINKTIARLRFEEAMKLIQEEELSISEAAFAVGFRHLSYFSSAFKKEYGVSPQEYFK